MFDVSNVELIHKREQDNIVQDTLSKKEGYKYSVAKLLSMELES